MEADQQYLADIEQKLESVGLSKEDKEKVIEGFASVDSNRNGYIEMNEIDELFQCVGKAPPAFRVRDCLEKLDTSRDGKLSPAEFASVYKTLCSDKAASAFRGAVKAKSDIVKKAGTAEGTQHSYSEEEMVAFCGWINLNLKDDPDLKNHNLPIDPGNEEEFFSALSDGIILCKMINLSQKDTIDERAINKKKSPNTAVQIHRDQENLNLALNSASAIGCSIVNIGATDIKEKKPHLILGMLWQVIRIGLFAAFDLERTPDLAALLEGDETLDDLMNLAPELLLLRWMNYHLKNSQRYKDSPRQGARVTNFSSDIKDSYAYMCLLEQIQPLENDEQYTGNSVVANVNQFPGTDKDSMVKRARSMLHEADKIKCRAFVTEYDVVKGNTKLNMAFVAHLFNTHPCLKSDRDEEIHYETREEKTFRNWMNSLGVSPRVNRLYNDLRDGLVFLQLYDHIKPDLVNKSKINKPPFNTGGGFMKKKENCNAVINYGRDLKYSLVGIDGNDLSDGNETATLSLSWQVMRGYTLGILERLSEKGATGEKAIVEWVNATLESCGKTTRIKSFKDPCISNSLVVIDLVDAVGGNGTIDYSSVCTGSSGDECELNAKYAISMARKIGARVYALPDDLCEVNPKMVMTVFACIMARAMQVEDEA